MDGVYSEQGEGKGAPSVWEAARRFVGDSCKIHSKELSVGELKHPSDNPKFPCPTWDLSCCPQSSTGGGCAGDAPGAPSSARMEHSLLQDLLILLLWSSELVLLRVFAECSLGAAGKCLHWEGLVNSELFLCTLLTHQTERCLSCSYFSSWYF